MTENSDHNYFELVLQKRINEFSRIDKYKNWESGKAKRLYKNLDEFYIKELDINKDELLRLREKFKQYNELYNRYFNEDRIQLFTNPEQLKEWFDRQNNSCNYCEITQETLQKIVELRNNNLTLNQKTKRSKGTLEIEKLDPNKGYTFDNCVLSCPFCNNAKSNLISEKDWRCFFVPAMKNYHKKFLTDNRS